MSEVRTSWVPVPPGSHFPLQNLPYGIFRPAGGQPRAGVAIGAHILDLAALANTGLLAGPGPTAGPGHLAGPGPLAEPVTGPGLLAGPGTLTNAGDWAPRRWFAASSLNAFMAAGPAAWNATRARLTELLGDPRHRHIAGPHLTRQEDADLLLPFEVADYVDFYSSRDHAATVGRIFRPGSPALPRNWLHLPTGYHGRAGSVVVSGTPVIRPCGQRNPPGGGAPVFGPTERLDFEAEVGFTAGVPSGLGQPVPVARFREHAFGFLLVNDWSARDIQSFEYQPLGPFLGKSFATSVSPWVVPVAALEAARVPPPPQDPEPAAYLRCPEPWGLDLTLEITINGQLVSRPRFRNMYWTSPQQLAHATVNGAPVRTGDLYASGTVSGGEAGDRGCLLELSWNATRPLTLPDGTVRSYLLDGDAVRISATAPGAGGVTIGFGVVEGTILPAAG